MQWDIGQPPVEVHCARPGDGRCSRPGDGRCSDLSKQIAPAEATLAEFWDEPYTHSHFGRTMDPPGLLVEFGESRWHLPIEAWPFRVPSTFTLVYIGVHFGCFARKIEGDSWFTW